MDILLFELSTNVAQYFSEGIDTELGFYSKYKLFLLLLYNR